MERLQAPAEGGHLAVVEWMLQGRADVNDAPAGQEKNSAAG